MSASFTSNKSHFLLGMTLCLIWGCASQRTALHNSAPLKKSETEITKKMASLNVPAETAEIEDKDPTGNQSEVVQLTAAEDESGESDIQIVKAEPEALPVAIPVNAVDDLKSLEQQALASNSSIRRLQHEVQAAWAKVPQVEALPDPTFGANIFGQPIETAAGSQRANLQLSQMIPWMKRLDAQGQQASYEAYAKQQVLKAEQQRVQAEVRAQFYRLYVLGKQIQVNRANQQLLVNLLETANARVAAGNGSQGDVLLGTLQISNLEEELIRLKQQRETVVSRINKLLNRSAETAIIAPNNLELRYSGWEHASLRELAYQHQPEIAASQLQEKATSWGVEVACLKRKPDFSINANYFIMDDNRPATNVVDVGEDAWSLGASITIPLWEKKNDARDEEARRKHFAAHANTKDVRQKYDSLLLEFSEKARAAQETADLYKATILPQARQTLEADLQSYTQGEVEFDRVIQDFRSLLTLELGYHRAVGEIGIAVALIQQAIGRDLEKK